PPCCTRKEQGPPKVKSGGTTDLQCGSKYQPNSSPHDVPGGVTYTIASCKDDPTKKCLHAQVKTSSDATIGDIHLNIGTDTDTLPGTGLGTWPFNKYCTYSGSVGDCWVPLSVIEALFSDTRLCGHSVNIAFGVKVTYAGGGGDTCFGKGAPLPGANWFMYSVLTFECPEVCVEYCCCKPPVVEPPTPPVSCHFGTAYGYGTGSVKFNDLDLPRPNTCKSKWGWYFAVSDPSISGTLFAGTAQNDVDAKGTDVGTFTAMLSGSNLIVSYSLKTGYDLGEVHVYASCSKPTTCAPGQFTYTGAGLDLSGTADTSFGPKSIAIAGAPPSCSTYYLIFHASVNKLYPAGSTCP
ncbi:hypothetical protein Micbo1qcDRAFT_112286, partial [Microdochium bolleyi]